MFFISAPLEGPSSHNEAMTMPKLTLQLHKRTFNVSQLTSMFIHFCAI